MDRQSLIRKDILIFILFIVISSYFGILFFKMPDWDFYSYHYYNGWAFWNDRINVDIMPCMFRTYFNPFLDAINYLLIEKLNNHSLFFIIISSFKYGIFMFIAYKLYNYILEKFHNNSFISQLFCIVTAGMSPILLYCISFDNNDIQLAIPILFGFYIYIKNVFKTGDKRRLLKIFASSLLAGLSFGLKYSVFGCCAAFVLMTLCLYKKIDKPIKTLFTVLFGLFCGFVITGGYWMWLLFVKFHNPLFPYFNNIFHSQMANSDSVLTSDFYHLLPKNIFEFLFYPLKNTLKNGAVGLEQTYLDLKIPLIFVIILLSLYFFKQKNIFNQFIENKENRNIYCALLSYIIFAYYINLLLFANIRYILPLFIISPVIICLFLKFITKKEFYNYTVVGILCLFFSVYAICPNIEYYTWAPSETIINIKNMKFKENATVICGTPGSSFILPHQNKKIEGIGYSFPKNLKQEKYLFDWHKQYRNYFFQNDYLDKRLEQNINKSDDVYIVYSLEFYNNVDDLFNKSLKRYNLKLKNCQILGYCLFDKFSSMGEFVSCKIK